MIINGKELALKIQETLKEQISKFKTKPHLSIIQVGENSASTIYVNNKIKACENVGIYVQPLRMKTATPEEIKEIIKLLNEDPRVNGIIVQLPLPEEMDEQDIINTIKPEKDVDGLTSVNVGLSLQGTPYFISATARGICEILNHYNISTAGKRVVVVGRSNIVGKPIATLLMQRPYFSIPNLTPGLLGDATVTVCHSKTQELGKITKEADILIVAAGCPGLIKNEMVKEGAVVIDVGINRVEGEGRKVVGDVDFEGVKDKVAFITPVPNGVGPMTVTSLLQNTVQAYVYQHR